MKIWVVNGKTVIDNEKSLRSFLVKEKSKNNGNTKIEMMEIVFRDGGKTVDQLLESLESENEGLKTTDQDFLEKLETFKNLYTKYAGPKNSLQFLTSLQATVKERKEIVNLCKRFKDHLLCEVSREIDWYESLIEVSGIDEMVDGFYQKLNGYNTRVLITDKTKMIFLKAKQNIEKIKEKK